MTATLLETIATARQRLSNARHSEHIARERAREVALQALDAGYSEVSVARGLGVDRMTVRKWRRDAGL
jgi:transposase-like protein